MLGLPCEVVDLKDEALPRVSLLRECSSQTVCRHPHNFVCLEIENPSIYFWLFCQDAPVIYAALSSPRRVAGVEEASGREGGSLAERSENWRVCSSFCTLLLRIETKLEAFCILNHKGCEGHFTARVAPRLEWTASVDSILFLTEANSSQRFRRYTRAEH